MLMKCPDCSGKVSDSAAACPHCGASRARLESSFGMQKVGKLIGNVIFFGGLFYLWRACQG